MLSFKRQSNSNFSPKKSSANSTKSTDSIHSSPSTTETDQADSTCDIEQAPKLGSLQVFIPSEGPIENYSPNLFPTDEVHKIAVLDVRLLNLDRNACNILVQNTVDPITKETRKRLIPIDHGLTLPDSLAIQSFDLAWLDFPQVEEAFSEKTL